MVKNNSLFFNLQLLSAEDLHNMSIDDAPKLIDIMKRKQEYYLAMHNAPITQGKGNDKRWTTRVPDPSKSDGRRIIRKPTLEEVQYELIQYYKEQEDLKKEAEKASPITVKKFYPLWVEYVSKRPDVASATIKKYKNDYIRYIQDSEFSHMKITDINTIKLEDFLISTSQNLHLTKKAFGNLFGYMNQMFKYAIRQGIIDKNPCESVDKKMVRAFCNNDKKSTEERILSDKEIKSLLQTLHYQQQESPLYMPNYAIELCLYTGLRVGEVVALKWNCIKNGELYITESEHRISHPDGADTYEIGDTKNKKERRIPISDDLHKLLNRIQALHKENGIISEFIIADANGRIIAPTISKAMYRRGNEAGINAKSIHAIRRTVSSKLNTILPRATVALIMGHTEEVNEEHYDYDTLELETKRNAMDTLLATA